MLLNIMLFILSIMNSQEPAMDEFFRSNGKIYVVVAVLSIIFVGIVIYLTILDKKIGHLEKMQKNDNKSE
ncbi:MAG: CcmD family protein [Bacteroidia bacterium]|nr:CcmD family protein [Bacteroidia bacterium]NNM16700.1 CcmD family protein [Bacteroidia bacterium]